MMGNVIYGTASYWHGGRKRIAVKIKLLKFLSKREPESKKIIYEIRKLTTNKTIKVNHIFQFLHSTALHVHLTSQSKQNKLKLVLI